MGGARDTGFASSLACVPGIAGVEQVDNLQKYEDTH
jgi:hypothetical protein